MSSNRTKCKDTEYYRIIPFIRLFLVEFHKLYNRTKELSFERQYSIRHDCAAGLYLWCVLIPGSSRTDIQGERRKWKSHLSFMIIKIVNHLHIYYKVLIFVKIQHEMMKKDREDSLIKLAFCIAKVRIKSTASASYKNDSEKIRNF